ncbi:MAG: hypothetical protein B9S32_10050 [Verrucomicrobia bacterium Tous-C9LFEB]|nr:MAG: hypothetical protein B9S32_10050 [Verrucomicrobia bacterium Tous-C9LFEB]
MDTSSGNRLDVPYLKSPPKVIPIDIGRQLFVDDFLIASATLKRSFHKPEKYAGNPIFKPETPLETTASRTGNWAAVAKSGGIWWDAKEHLFRMWYEAGWLSTVALATSRDGLSWERPDLDVVRGTNQVLPTDLTPDSWTVVPNFNSTDPEAQWTLYVHPPVAQTGITPPSTCLTSPDGIHWTRRKEAGPAGDRSTHHYNPFRKKWVFSLRSSLPEKKRARSYYECEDFMKGCGWGDAEVTTFWLAADREDPIDPSTGQDRAQLYNFDAVAYESLMLGLFEIHMGPENPKCQATGMPKITELMFAYSRDGFHWDRPDRRSAIGAEKKDVWDRAYIQSVGSVCNVRGDQLWFYYSGFQGNPAKTTPEIKEWQANGMYDRGSMGVAFLRRDGFASMDAGNAVGSLTTRPVQFSGTQLFVNVAASKGRLRAEIRNQDGTPIIPFTIENSVPFTGDSTATSLKWNGASDLTSIKGRPVVFYFELENGSLYSFWVSRDESGRSDGFVAGGGPGFTGPTDTVGTRAIAVDRAVRSSR